MRKHSGYSSPLIFGGSSGLGHMQLGSEVIGIAQEIIYGTREQTEAGTRQSP